MPDYVLSYEKGPRESPLRVKKELSVNDDEEALRVMTEVEAHNSACNILTTENRRNFELVKVIRRS